MESLTPEELRQALKGVLELASCPVCLETLSTDVVLCLRGHLVCEPCRRQLPKPECPKCRGGFCSSQPTWFIRQVIASLPHTCRHKNCDYFVRTKDEHEKFCSFKFTNCRYCRWSGPEKLLVSHIKEKHTELNKYFVPLLGNMERGLPFNPKIECSVFTPIFVEGHFFWGEMVNDPKAGKLTTVFHPIGNGKTETEFTGSVKLNFMEFAYSADVKLNMDPDKNPYDENCISIPPSIMHKFTVDNKFQYTLTVEVTMLESLVTWVQSGIKSGIGFLKSYKQ